MNRDQVLAVLRRHRQDIEQRFAIKHLSVFGSAARDELRTDSDIDVLVEFQGKATFDGYMDLKFYLETLLGRNVDLVTQDAVKPRMRPIIEQEAIHVTTPLPLKWRGFLGQPRLCGA
jgi:predicted nucleotidyltransferase